MGDYYHFKTKELKLKDFKSKDNKGKFFTAFAPLKGNTPISIFVANSGAMVQGHKGQITEIDYLQIVTNAKRVPVLTEDQKIVLENGDTVILAEAGSMPVAPTISWSTGRTMTLGLLAQGGTKSSVQFLKEGAKSNDDLEDPIPASQLTKDHLERMVGKSFECTKFFRDTNNMIIREGRAPYAANCYEFVEYLEE